MRLPAVLALAEYVESNPGDVSADTLLRLEGQANALRGEARVSRPRQTALAFLRRYGFEYEPGDLGTALDELSARAVRDVQRDQTRRRL